jgi:magnesium transporter
MIRTVKIDGDKVIRDVPVESIRQEPAKDTWYWVDLDQPTEEELKLLDTVFHFHPLAIEDCGPSLQRPKVEDYDEYLFIVVHAIKERKNERKRFTVHEVNLFLGPGFLVTVHLNEQPSIDRVFSLFEKKTRFHDLTPNYLAYLIIDHIVDEFFPWVDELENQLNKMEEKLFHIKNPTDRLINRIFELRRLLLALRKVVLPHRDLLSLLLHDDFINRERRTRAYFMDIYDHLMRLMDRIDSQREIVSGLLEMCLSLQSKHMNEIMKILTIFGTVFLPITFISSVYGMNFDVMPELHWKYGYPFALGLMALTAVCFVLYFKRKHWL